MGLRELYGNQEYKQILRDQLQINYDNLERLKWALEDKKGEITSKYEELNSLKGYDAATKEARAIIFEEIQQLKREKQDILDAIQEEREYIRSTKDEIAGL